MNPAITAAIIAAQEQSPTLVQRLEKAGAVHNDKAMAVAIATSAQQAELAQALRQGLVKRRSDGHFYLDQKAIRERNERIGRAFLLWTAIALSFVASGAALLAFAR